MMRHVKEATVTGRIAQEGILMCFACGLWKRKEEKKESLYRRNADVDLAKSILRYLNSLTEMASSQAVR